MRDTAWRFVLKWAAATAVGGLPGGLAFIPFLSTGGPTPKVIAGAAIGLGFGVGQWLVIRRHIDGAVWWIVATIAGFAAAGAAVGTGTTEELAMRGLNTETLGFVFGAAAGVSQWLVLRLHSARALWWIPASVAAFGIGWFLNWKIDFGLDYNDPLTLILGIMLILVPFVLISGLSLGWILNSSPSNST